jgi:putative CRISPR-associated protein (TIGR02619 family)
MKPKYILSPCGTSLLTNQAGDLKLRKLISEHANKKSKADIPTHQRERLEELLKTISEEIKLANSKKAVQLSAELNGIIKINNSIPPETNNYYLILATDTWLGEETAKLVEGWLKHNYSLATTEVYRHTDLQTEDMDTFQASLSELIKKFYEELPPYSTTGYKIIFNLTGGFKAVQGFLQSIANFYADETVYIFEKSEQLMRIPKLPVSLNGKDVIEKKLTQFRNLAANLPVDTEDIPKTLLLELAGESTLSPWGEILWHEHKTSLYQEKLWDSPDQKKIRYANSFKKSVESLSGNRLVMINEKIDQLNKYLTDGKHLNSLDFKKLHGDIKQPSTHEIDAWSDQDAKRIFGHYEDQVFVLDILGKALH